MRKIPLGIIASSFCACVEMRLCAQRNASSRDGVVAVRREASGAPGGARACVVLWESNPNVFTPRLAQLLSPTYLRALVKSQIFLRKHSCKFRHKTVRAAAPRCGLRVRVRELPLAFCYVRLPVAPLR